MRLFNDLIPVCLYTYETASSRRSIIDFKPEYKDIEKVVTKYFGANSMDNKITMVFEDMDNIRIYATYWDGNLRIGLDIFFLNDHKKPGNEYMTVKPIV